MVISEVEHQGDMVIQIISQTIRNAEGVNSPSKGGSASLLSLDVVNVSLDPTVFDLNAEVIRVTESVGLAIPLTSDSVHVTSLDFRNLTKNKGFGSIKFQFTIEYDNPANISDFEYSKTFYATADLRQ